MDIPLLETKLYVPPLRPERVPRGRLLERLVRGSEGKLTLVCAPAGYGKTTLVTEWIHALRSTIDGSPTEAARQERIIDPESGAHDPQSKVAKRFAWLSLDESDNDPARFLAYLLAALRKVDPHLGVAAEAMLQTPQPPPPAAFLTLLVNDIAALPHPLVLVLDDYHLIQSPPVHQQVDFLLAYGPPPLHLVIVTREDPPLSLARLRARGQMAEIRQADLAFTPEEAAALLADLRLAPPDLAALHQRTEGWIAGLQLAALSLQGVEDTSSFVASFTGSHRYVLDYLIEEVFRRQPPDMQEFLLKTAILDPLTAPLCDALTGRSDGRAILSRMEESNLFLVPLDDRRVWYRYHRLFRDLLRSQQDEGQFPELHRRAARWYRAGGLLIEAIPHALASRDWDEAERIIADAAPAAIGQGQFATLHGWLAALPEARVRQSPGLATLMGWSLLVLGQLDPAASYADLAEALLPADAPPLERCVLMTLRSYFALARNDAAATILLCERALALLDEGDPHFLRGALLSNLAQAQTVLGDIPAATRTYRELVRLSLQYSHPLSAVSGLTNLAWFLRLQGQRREAIAVCERALAQCVDAHGRSLPLAGYPHIVLGILLYDADELGPAQEHLLQGIEMMEHLGPSGGALTGLHALARVQQAMGEGETALATVARLRQLAEPFHLPHVDDMVAGVEAAIQLRQGNVAAAAHWAESAGLSPTDRPDHVREEDYFTYARLLLAQDRLEEAQTLLGSLGEFCRAGERQRSLITVEILQALVEHAFGRQGRALGHLENALRLAAPEGHRRPFFEEGLVVLRLLPRVRPLAPLFVDQLLGQASRELVPPRPAASAQLLAEPLSERELEVLALAAAGLSNREIAERLIVSLGTVKTHMHNILGKLEVQNRTQAVTQARGLGLVSSSS